MRAEETAPTVAITGSTLKELGALRFAFMGELLPNYEKDAYDDELIAMMLGFELRTIAKPESQLARLLLTEITARVALLKRAPASVLRSLTKRSGVTAGIARPGYLLDARGLDADTPVVLNARAAMVSDFAELAGQVFRSPAVTNKRNAIFALLRQLSDQQIIDLVIWATLAQFDDDNEPNDYPLHIEKEINARVEGRLMLLRR